MSPRPFGVGVGVVLLGSLWTLCLLGWAAAVRKHRIRASIVYPLVSSVLTIGLILWPRENCHNVPKQRILLGEDEAAENGANATAGGASADTSAAFAPTAGEEQQIDWLAIPRIVFAFCLIFLALFATSRHLRAKLFNRAPLPPAATKWRYKE